MHKRPKRIFNVIQHYTFNADCYKTTGVDYFHRYIFLNIVSFPRLFISLPQHNISTYSLLSPSTVLLFSQLRHPSYSSCSCHHHCCCCSLLLFFVFVVPFMLVVPSTLLSYRSYFVLVALPSAPYPLPFSFALHYSTSVLLFYKASILGILLLCYLFTVYFEASFSCYVLLVYSLKPSFCVYIMFIYDFLTSVFVCVFAFFFVF